MGHNVPNMQITQLTSGGHSPRPSAPCLRILLRFYRVALLALSFLSFAACAEAHNGPPFPILENRPVGPCVISVWTNPDVGTGVFFVMVDPISGSTIPADLKVEIGVQPVSARLPQRTYRARQENLRGQVEYKAEVPFDARELWRVRVKLASSQGDGEAVATVQVTPPGLGRWDLLLYVLPFAGIGFLWFRAATTKRRSVQALR